LKAKQVSDDEDDDGVLLWPRFSWNRNNTTIKSILAVL